LLRIVFLTDRSPVDALPVLASLGLDVKTERMTTDGFAELAGLAPSAVLVDCEADPDVAYALLAAHAELAMVAPIIAVLRPEDLDRLPWERVVDEVLLTSASAAEIRLRLTMLAQRTGGLGDSVLRLGPLAIDTETYRVTLAGRRLDLTYKEFELLRFLVQHPGRVHTRAALLHEVWGYDFYGGTRTVDVHVRRLRAKLGVDAEDLIETVRGVGYRAAEPPL
jgi:DNA-binding response OmpR family regulator